MSQILNGKKRWWDDVPSDLAPSSKIRAGLLGPHYPVCLPASQPSRSIKAKKKGDEGDKPLGASQTKECAHFKRDVIISDADFQLLLADDVFLWPVRIVFPLNDNDRSTK